ncbi:hypothetical protein FRC07_011683, partial [Ceratobasidium sp. 392]
MSDHLSRCSLGEIPDEIVIKILLFCGYRDVLWFCATCNKYMGIISNSTSIQLHIELEANGLQLTQDFSEGSMDHSSLLSRLQRYRDAWLDLDLGAPVRHFCGHERLWLWELQDGTFAKAVNTPTDSPASHLGPNSLKIFPLTTTDSTQVDFGYAFNEFTLDPSQNLAVLVGINPDAKNCAWVRFCSSATGQAHPQAKRALVTAELGFDVTLNTIYDIVLKINNEFVAVKFSSFSETSYEILIWNWKSGALTNSISRHNSICSFCFLDSNHLVLWSAYGDDGGVLGSVELLLYELLNLENPKHEALDGQALDHPLPANLIPVLRFQFPKLQDASEVSKQRFLAQSDYGSTTSFATSTPFAHSSALTLGLTMTIIFDLEDSPWADNISYRIFVDIHQLFWHSEQAKQRTVSTLAWTEWGENATRWFKADLPDSWICWIFGSRFITRGKHISILDFHTPTVRRYSNRQRDVYASLELSAEDVKEREKGILSGDWPQQLRDGDIVDVTDGILEHDPSENAVVVDIVGSNQFTSLPYFGEP